MPASSGRSHESRSVSSVGTTNTSTALTAAAGTFDPVGDVGRTITGTGIPGGATLTAVAANGSGATLSAAATATGTVTVSLGAVSVVSPSLGFIGWSPTASSEIAVHTVAAVNAGQNAPTRILDTGTSVGSFQRSRG